MGVVWELKKTLGVVQMWLGWKVVRVETRSLKFLGRSFALTWGEHSEFDTESVDQNSMELAFR